MASPTSCWATTARSRRGPTTRCCGSRAGGRCRCAARAARCRARSPCRCPPAATCWPAAPSSRARSASPAGRRAWVSHHIGDLKNVETLGSFSEGVAHFERLFAVAPEVVVHDLHPDYLSTTYALAREGVEHVAVQHHHAHLAACLAEHGETGPAVGAIFDGTGLGTDGTVWGGEILFGGLRGVRARRPPVARPAARGRRRGARAVADGVRLAGRGGRRRTAAARRRSRPLADGGADGGDRHRVAGHDIGRPPVRRGRRALRPAARGLLRGAGGDGARGRLRRRRARCLPARAGGRRARRARGDPRRRPRRRPRRADRA